MSVAATIAPPPAPPSRRVLALWLLLGFSAGLPFYMFNAVLLLRLSRHGVDIVTIGFFAWIALLPTFKFAWAPLLERWAVPGFTRFWGRRRGWIMLAQLGIAGSLVAMAFTADDVSLPLTALFAVLLAFWTTTLEVAADGWRIELAPTAAEQGPLVAANLWGYRSAMVAAGSGAVLVAAWADWTAAYLLIALAAFLPFPMLAATPGEAGTARAVRWPALTGGVLASGAILLLTAALTALVGAGLLQAAAGLGIGADSNVAPAVLLICLLPFVALAVALPRIQRLPPGADRAMNSWIAPYVELFWRHGYGILVLLAFVSVYRMGDVLALTLSHPMWNETGYTLQQIGVADGVVSLVASMVGVALGGWAVVRLPLRVALACGAVAAGCANLGFMWQVWQVPSAAVLYGVVAADQFSNGLAGAVFVVFLSMQVSARYPAAQYAFLSGFAFLLPRLLAGAGGAMQQVIGYDGFFALSGTLTLAALLFLPFMHGRQRVEPPA